MYKSSSRLLITLSLSLLFATAFISANAQSELLPLSQDLQLKLGRKIYFDTAGKNHTALQRYITNELSTDSVSQDSLLRSLYPERKAWQSKNWFYRKLFLEHLVEVKTDEYSFYLDFLPDLQIGKQDGNNLSLNTRGIELGGRIGKKFAFTSHFFENQAKFPAYITDFITKNRVTPGQGYVKPDGVIDFSQSGATLSYTASKYLNLQLGYDKNFIGDGYRSLFLSDNTYNYPFIKATGTLGKVRYMAMFAQFIDFQDTPYDETQSPYPKKYGIFHYLSYNVNKRLSLGLFQNVMWARESEFGYFVPLMFLKSAEFANGSPDKALYGFNGSYKIADRYVAYGQLMINEFRIKDIFSGRGHWANKQGGQLGIKGFDVFKVNKLNAQLEMNVVRPYSYSSRTHFTNYGHFGQPLAHPYGANFKEYLSIINYRYKNFDARLQLTKATYGLDVDSVSYGKDIYKPYDLRPTEEGVYIGHGLKTNLFYAQATVAYILNPKNNLRIEIGYTHRKESNSQYTDKQQIFNIGLRSSFRNSYNDF
ncbi:hypothetical protein AAKU52_000649 [Pedobacter sp. CG_S7]|uniref:hypothetical protein n=1 Tax=Pedobacter sp. CG_S7 TaxID=3143930 RepID=UPI0033934AC0